jgi:hypothetical protein
MADIVLAQSKFVGSFWFLVGVIYPAVRTRGFYMAQVLPARGKVASR